MGYTDFTIRLLEKVIKEYQPKMVVDLGAQNMYNQPVLPAPYASEWYKEQGIVYVAIDLSGENDALEIDLGKPSKPLFPESQSAKFEMVVDAGTSEHIGTDGKFDWEAIYNCWKTKHSSLRTDGIMVNENPLTGHWPGHGFQYYTEAFYKELAAATDYELLELGTACAMGNCTTGMNVYCILRKHSDKFVTVEQFKTFSLYQQ